MAASSPPAQADEEQPSNCSRRANSVERAAVACLPDVWDRIDKMGLSQEYIAFRERYQGWRQGNSQGARGELCVEAIEENLTANIDRKGFGDWYSSAEVWTFRRTLSYWISVTFFEGSLFFTVSSFFLAYPETLGRYTMALTTCGYLAGKVNYFICTYLMCVETINLDCKKEPSLQPISPNTSHTSGGKETWQASMQPLAASDSTNVTVDEEEREVFYWWPFHFRTAVGKLNSLGVGPYPYYASVVYFVGVMVYFVAIVSPFMTFLPEVITKWTSLITYVIGGILFTLGGLAECVSNDVFTTYQCSEIGAGWVGSVMNTLGGGLFLLGSLFGFFDGLDYWGSMCFAIGAIAYAVGSSVMIVMWKDEQFGLTFLPSLNNLGGPNGRPIVYRGGVRDVVPTVEEEATFSWRGACFIMLYCLAATVSTYNFLMDMSHIGASDESLTYVLERSFNAFLPCIFAHTLLGLNSAVVKVPKGEPFRTLYLACRFLAVLMIFSGTANLVESLMRQDHRFH